MARQHMACEACGRVVLLTYAAADVDDPFWPGPSYCCDAPLLRTPQPGDFTFDLKTDGDGDKGFQKFTVHRQVPTKDGLQQVEETIDSVHKLRQIERDSEQRYRNGEGEPLRFRAYAQNASNTDVGAFGTSGQIGERVYSSGETPKKKPNISVRRHGEAKPKIPVARGGGVTALKG